MRVSFWRRELGVDCFEKVIKIKHLANHINRESNCNTPTYLLDPAGLEKATSAQVCIFFLLKVSDEVTLTRQQP
jgi:hypothetical protein